MSDWDAFPLAQQQAAPAATTGWDAFPIAPQSAQPSMAMDAAKSLPSGMLGGLSSALSSGGQAAAIEMGQPDLQAQIPGADQTKQIIEQNVTGEMHKPQTAAGRIAYGAGEALGNPASYIGPGGLALKTAGAALSGAGSEAAKEAATGTGYEVPASIAGALAGGVLAGKAFAPAAEKAVTPTVEELAKTASAGYDRARNSGLELHPAGVGQFASTVEQNLAGKGLTGGTNGTAPKTLEALGGLQNPPAGAVAVTPTNLDALRKTLGEIALETKPGPLPIPTSDAKAATLALERLRNYTENLPQSHILAGDPADYVQAIKQANGDWAAMRRAQAIEARVTAADNATNRGKATTLGDQLRNKLAPVLDNPLKQRGMNDAEKAQLQRVNDGTPVGNLARQLGRGVGVIPALAGVTTAAVTGGASIPASAALAAAALSARYLGSRSTVKAAEKLNEMLLQRSPEYQKRVAALPPPPSSAPQMAQLMRSLLLTR